MSEVPGKNKGVAAEDMGKERQKADIHFLGSLLGATEVVSEIANVAFWLHARSKFCQVDAYGQKNRLYKNIPIEVPTWSSKKRLV